MTVILDPGTDVGYSFSDGLRRAWRDTAGLWRVDRDLWKGRADSAWGASRVWNTGASWETNYNAEVALYNDMVAQRDAQSGLVATWQGRANNAWGATRVWGSGESWEAAYSRVLPPGSVDHWNAALSNSSAIDRGTWVTVGGSLSAPRSGYFLMYAQARGNQSNQAVGGGTQYGQVRILVGGNNAADGPQTIALPQSSGGDGSLHAFSEVRFASSGQSIQVQVRTDGGNPGLTRVFTNNSIDIWFVPTAGYPH